MTGKRLSVFDGSAPERFTLTFSMEGVGARDELLFKSFVRLLSHRTSQNWNYQPAAAGANRNIQGNADLRVVAQGMDNAPETGCSPLLILGATSPKAPGYLSLPFKAQELEDELNRVGASIMSTRNQLVTSPATLAGKAVKSVAGSTDIFRLLRWPPPTILKSSSRMRLATLLTGRGMTLKAIEQRSGESAGMCIEFLNELYGAGLLSSKPGEALTATNLIIPSADPTTAGKRGLLTRIRSRLGLQFGTRA